jgi:hypothetical protein
VIIKPANADPENKVLINPKLSPKTPALSIVVVVTGQVK